MKKDLEKENQLSFEQKKDNKDTRLSKTDEDSAFDALFGDIDQVQNNESDFTNADFSSWFSELEVEAVNSKEKIQKREVKSSLQIENELDAVLSQLEKTSNITNHISSLSTKGALDTFKNKQTDEDNLEMELDSLLISDNSDLAPKTKQKNEADTLSFELDKLLGNDSLTSLDLDSISKEDNLKSETHEDKTPSAIERIKMLEKNDLQVNSPQIQELKNELSILLNQEESSVDEDDFNIDELLEKDELEALKKQNEKNISLYQESEAEDLLINNFSETVNANEQLTQNSQQESLNLDQIWEQAYSDILEFNNSNKEASLELSLGEFQAEKINEKIIILFEQNIEALSAKSDNPKEFVEDIKISKQRNLKSKKLERIFSLFEDDAHKDEEQRKEEESLGYFKVFSNQEDGESRVILPHSSPTKRSIGALIDFIFVFSVSVLLSCTAILPSQLAHEIASFSIPDFYRLAPYIMNILQMHTIVWLIYVSLLTSGSGQTFGQAAMKIMTLNQSAKIPSLKKAILRALSQSVSIITFGIGFLPIFGKYKQSLHDIIAGTMIADARSYDQLVLEKFYKNYVEESSKKS